MNPKARKILLLLVKLALAGGLVAWAVTKVHWNDYEVQKVADDGQTIREIVPGVGSALTDITPLPIAGALAIALGIPILMACRWRLLLGVQDVSVTFTEAVRLTFLGMFFNTVVPSPVGGAVFKAYYVAKHTPNKAAVLVGTFVDRAIGMFGLALLSAIALAIASVGQFVPAEQLQRPVIALAIIGGMMLLAGVFIFSQRFRRIFHLQKLYGRLPIAHHIAAAGDAAALFRQHVGHMLAALGLSLTCHLLFVTAILLLGTGASLGIPWPHYFLYIPLIYVIGAVPVTPGGLGLVENLYVMFFIAANPSGVMALALLARLIPLSQALPGVFVFLSGPRPPKAMVMKAELQAAEDEALQAKNN